MRATCRFGRNAIRARKPKRSASSTRSATRCSARCSTAPCRIRRARCSRTCWHITAARTSPCGGRCSTGTRARRSGRSSTTTRKRSAASRRLTEFAPEEPKRRNARPVYTYRFPVQQHKVGGGSFLDPHRRDAPALEVVAVDDDEQLVRLKKWPDTPHPRALVPGGPIATGAQRAALRRLAEAELDGTIRSRYSAARDILHRAFPRITGLHAGARVQPAMRPGAEAIDPADVADLARRLDHSALMVQGPPGTGKTYTGAHVIAALLADGKRIGITSTSHKAINNLLHEVEAAVARRGASFRGVKRCDASNDDTRFVSAQATAFVECAEKNASFAEYDLVAGTSWLLAREDLARVDYLVIDEAGQVALADALAMATNADNVILLGDPLQLAHVSLGVHPGGRGRVGAGAPARRARHRAGGPRRVPGPHVSHAPGAVRLRVDDGVRRPACARRRRARRSASTRRGSPARACATSPVDHDAQRAVVGGRGRRGRSDRRGAGRRNVHRPARRHAPARRSPTCSWCRRTTRRCGS